MHIAVIGYGHVGGPLADHVQRVGHEVTLAARDAASERLSQLRARNPALRVADPREAVGGIEQVLRCPFPGSHDRIPLDDRRRVGHHRP